MTLEEKTMAASGGNQLKSSILRLMCELLSLLLLLLYYNTTDRSQGPGACWESRPQRGICLRVSSVKVPINHRVGTSGPSPLL